MDSKFWQRSALWRTAYALELISIDKMDKIINSKKWVRYEELLGIRNVGIVAREMRCAEEEKMRKSWRLAREKGKCKSSSASENSLKEDPSAELLRDLVNSNPVERLPPGRFLRASLN